MNILNILNLLARDAKYKDLSIKLDNNIIINWQCSTQQPSTEQFQEISEAIEEYPEKAADIKYYYDLITSQFKIRDDFLLANIRKQRNVLLTKSDWTTFTDSPLTSEKKHDWTTYRQALRDFPETCDPENPVWPTAPEI